MMNWDREWAELKLRLAGHLHSMMDAPYFGWSSEFIDGYAKAIERVQQDIARIESDPDYPFHSDEDLQEFWHQRNEDET